MSGGALTALCGGGCREMRALNFGAGKCGPVEVAGSEALSYLFAGVTHATTAPAVLWPAQGGRLRRVSLGLMQGPGAGTPPDALSFFWVLCSSQTVDCGRSAGSLGSLGARTQKKVNGPGR